MRIEIEPDDMAGPAANYAHAVVVGAGRTLYTSGVVPLRVDGTTPTGVREQAEIIWDNIGKILRTATMRPADIVSVTTYAAADFQPSDLRDVMDERDRHVPVRAASTLVVVAALAQPEWKVEIAIVAVSSEATPDPDPPDRSPWLSDLPPAGFEQ